MPSQQFEALIQVLKSRPRLADFSIPEQRVMFEEITSQFPLAEGTLCEPLRVGGLNAEWIAAPGASEDRVVYYLHGGGYAIGSVSTHRALVSRLSSAAGARFLVIDYRLAPENPFPAAVEDAVTGYRWLLSTGIEANRVVIAGDSGGGGLTMATLIDLHDAGDALPAAAVCMSPWVDLTCAGGSLDSLAEQDLVVTKQWLQMLAAAYLAGADARTPLASPLFADLRGLPPILLQVGSAEILLGEVTTLAERAEAAGVPVTLDVWEDMFHFWQAFASVLPEGQQAIDRAGEFMRQHTPGAR